MARRVRRRRTRGGLPLFIVVALASVVASSLWKDVPPSRHEDTAPSSAPPFGAAGRGNARIQSFTKAKKLLVHVYAGHEETFYCGCRYTGNVVDLESCGYRVRNNANRALRLEWDHVVPAENFGRLFPEWREGHPSCVDRKGQAFTGRNCARKAASLFRFMESDLYNLQPAIGEINARRSNARMGMVPGEQREFGMCDVEIADRRIEPRPDIRGDIARTYLGAIKQKAEKFHSEGEK